MFATTTSSSSSSSYYGLNGLNVLVFPELRNSETRERSESYVEDLGSLAEAPRSRRLAYFRMQFVLHDGGT